MSQQYHLHSGISMKLKYTRINNNMILTSRNQSINLQTVITQDLIRDHKDKKITDEMRKLKLTLFIAAELNLTLCTNLSLSQLTCNL